MNLYKNSPIINRTIYHKASILTDINLIHYQNLNVLTLEFYTPVPTSGSLSMPVRRKIPWEYHFLTVIPPP